MASCAACSRAIPDGVAHCPYCGREQPKDQTGSKTMFGFAPSPEELRKLMEQESAAAAAPSPVATPASETPQAPTSETPRAPAPAPRAPGTFAEQPTVFDMDAPPVGERASTAPHEAQVASFQATPPQAPQAAPPQAAQAAAAPQAAAPSPFGAPQAAPPQAAAPQTAPAPQASAPSPFGAPQAAPPHAAPPQGAAHPPGPSFVPAGIGTAPAHAAPMPQTDPQTTPGHQAPVSPPAGDTPDTGQAAAPGAAASAPATAASGPSPKVELPGVRLAEGEYPIAVEKPGIFFWVLFGILCALILTLPWALWMLLVTASKRYIITNKRSIRIKFTGKVLELPHDKLKGFKTAGFMGASNVSLRLRGKGAPDLLFGLCGPMAAMARLWGVLYFWVLGPDVDIDQAPAVDADGKVLDASYDLDILLYEKTQFRRGALDLAGAQMYGVTIITPNRFMWLRNQAIGDDSAADLPVYAFVLSLAKRCSDVASFEAEVERVAKSSLAESVSRRWDNLVDPKLGRTGLVFEDKGKKCTLWVASKHKQTFSAYVNEHTDVSL